MNPREMLLTTPVGFMRALCEGADLDTMTCERADGKLCSECGKPFYLVESGESRFLAPSCLCDSYAELEGYVRATTEHDALLVSLVNTKPLLAFLLAGMAYTWSLMTSDPCIFEKFAERLEDIIADAIKKE